MMNPGVPEQVGESARTFMTIMKDNPLSLALVVMNLCLLGFVYFFAQSAKEERQTELQLLYQNRREVGQLLHDCYPTKQQ